MLPKFKLRNGKFVEHEPRDIIEVSFWIALAGMIGAGVALWAFL